MSADPAPSPAPTGDGPSSATPEMNRRQLLQTIGTTAAAGVGLSAAQTASASFNSIGNSLPNSLWWRIFSGSDADEDDEILGAIEFEDHLIAYNRGREWWAVDRETELASLQNDVNNLYSQAFNHGIRRVYEGALLDEDYETARDAGIDAAGEIADEVFEWIVTYTNRRLNSHAVTEGLNLGVLQLYEPGDNDCYTYDLETSDVHEDQIPLPSGDGEAPITYLSGEWYDNWHYFGPYFEGGYIQDGYDCDGQRHNSHLRISEPDPEDYDVDNPEDYEGYEHVDGWQRMVDPYQLRDLLQEVEAQLASAEADISQVAEDHWNVMQDRDVELAELVSPQGLLRSAGEAEDADEAALYFRGAEYPRGEEGVLVDAELPEGADADRAELEGYLAWNVAEDGEELPVGSMIDPANLLGSIFMAAQYEDDDGEMTASVFELVDPFEIVSTESGSDQLIFEDPTEMPDADTDPGEAIEIFQTNRDSEEDAREQTIEIVLSTDDGLDFGGLWGGSGLNGPLIGAAIAVFVAVVTALKIAIDAITP